MIEGMITAFFESPNQPRFTLAMSDKQSMAPNDPYSHRFTRVRVKAEGRMGGVPACLRDDPMSPDDDFERCRLRRTAVRHVLLLPPSRVGLVPDIP